MMKLVNPCKYSFKDLLRAAGQSESTEVLYRLTQGERNVEVRKLCSQAGWFWRDIRTTSGIIYTAFSPEIRTEKPKNLI